jgi:hypothetical protein
VLVGVRNRRPLTPLMARSIQRGVGEERKGNGVVVFGWRQTTTIVSCADVSTKAEGAVAAVEAGQEVAAEHVQEEK